MRAFVNLKDTPHYRRAAFQVGLQAAGLSLCTDATRADVLVTWNRHGYGNSLATQAERRGARVIVAENGYLGSEHGGRKWFALSLSHHNGAGHWCVGGPERWQSLGVELKPWRTDGAEIVYLPQRGIGEPGIAMPRGWSPSLKGFELPIRTRLHPGIMACKPLLEDLEHAAGVITWGSGAAIKALAAGIPVQYGFAQWIGALAASSIGSGFVRNDVKRKQMFERLAWAQWTAEEVASGEPFARLLTT